MKKIFLLCMAGALAMTAASCGEDDEGGGKFGKMTVNGRTEEVKSAIYGIDPAYKDRETEIGLYLFKDVVTEMPQEMPDFTIAITIGQSHLGKTIDLTKPLSGRPGFYVAGMNGKSSFYVTSSEGSIEAIDFNTPDEVATVTSGTALVSRNGDEFTVKLSVTLSTGSSATVDWKGTATQVNFDN